MKKLAIIFAVGAAALMGGSVGLCRRQCGEVEIFDGCHAIADCHAIPDRYQFAQYRHGIGAAITITHWGHRHYRPYYGSYDYYAPRRYGYYGSPLLRRRPRRYLQLRQRRLSRLVTGQSDETRKPASNAGFFRLADQIDGNSYNSRAALDDFVRPVEDSDARRTTDCLPDLRADPFACQQHGARICLSGRSAATSGRRTCGNAQLLRGRVLFVLGFVSLRLAHTSRWRKASGRHSRRRSGLAATGRRRPRMALSAADRSACRRYCPHRSRLRPCGR